jgi:hypothetical protein
MTPIWCDMTILSQSEFLINCTVSDEALGEVEHRIDRLWSASLCLRPAPAALWPLGTMPCVGRSFCMTTFLYWLVYNFDLGPLGPRLLDMAVKGWLRRERHDSALVARQGSVFVASST